MISSMVKIFLFIFFLSGCSLVDDGYKLRSSKLAGYPDIRDVPEMPTDYPRKKDWRKLEKSLEDNLEKTGN